MPPRFSPPGNLNDLTRDADLQAWSDTVSTLLDGHIAPGGQLFNPITTPRPNLRSRRIPWLAIPHAAVRPAMPAPRITTVLQLPTPAGISS